jgi:hypothetical protein
MGGCLLDTLPSQKHNTSERSTCKVAKPKTWTVKVDNKTHKVEVRRKPWLAIGEVKVDGTRVGMFAAKAMSITLSSHYRQHQFEIDGTLFSVVIKPNFFGYNFDLASNGEVLTPDE